MSFSTGGGTTKVFQSKATISKVAVGDEVAPDFGGAIGVGDNGPEGVDIVTGTGDFSFTWKVAQVTVGRFKQLQALTGCVNLVAWGLYDVPELLFLGAEGHYSDGDGKWSITYRFSFQPSYIPLKINDELSLPAKFGWDYVWVLYEEKTDPTAHKEIRKPLAAYAEQVYEAKDFKSELGFE